MILTFTLNPYPEIPWDSPDTPDVAALWRRFNEMFADWKPRRVGRSPKSGGYRCHSLDAEVDDRRLDQQIDMFTQEVNRTGKAGGEVDVELTAAEMKRARYIEFGARSLENPNEELPAARNVYPALCDVCGFPDLSKVPSPFWVSKEVRKRPKEDLFSTREGLLIVRPRALEVLRVAIGNEIEFGAATVVGEEPEKFDPLERFWWVRPVHAIEPTQGWYVAKRCPKCNRPVHAHYNPPNSSARRSRQFSDWRPRVPKYGKHVASLVRQDEFAGHVSNDGIISFHQRLAISGSLFEHLKKMKVRGGGLNISGARKVCILSKKPDEAPLEPSVRKFTQPDELKLDQLSPKPKTVVKLDPSVVRHDVAESWKRIDEWLKKHAPRVHKALAAGASEKRILDMERKLKITLPEDVKASWRIHDGGEESDLFPSTQSDDMGYSLLSLDEMGRDFKRMPGWEGWEKGWLPLATNGGGDYQCVDLRGDDGDPATIGRIIEFNHEVSDYEPVAQSLAKLLRDLADGLESGKYPYDEHCGIQRVED